MKNYDVYGIKMTSLEQMAFSKYLDNNRIAMNTFEKEERKEIAKKWKEKNKGLIGIKVDKSKATHKHIVRDTVFKKGSKLNN